ncbi:MAG: N-acetyl-gamma-glutamyl-phosphate reductase [Bacillota bacterium]
MVEVGPGTMIRAGVVGASGYAGGELVRLLLGHRGASVTALASRGGVGKEAFEVYPGLRGYDLPRFSDVSPVDLARRCDIVFIAAPSGASVRLAREILDASTSTRVIDLGADFRLRNAALYPEWYGMVHDAPDLLAEAAYGLPELNRDGIRHARIVANPGCYPTAALLALAPIAARGLLDTGGVVIDAKSGVSGAGRTPSVGYHFPECEENLRPYGVLRHRHTPEIEQELRRVARHRGDGVPEPESGSETGSGVVVSFVPHLVPMSRGILVTAYASLKRPGPSPGNGTDSGNRAGAPAQGRGSAGEVAGGIPRGAAGGVAAGIGHQGGNGDEAAGRGDGTITGDPPDTNALTSLYEEFYAGERFVRVLRGDDLPQTKAVRGSNFCDIAVRADPRTGRVVAMAAIDNLVKGAAGQAIQNMNILFGLDESMGLDAPPMWP